MQHNDPIKYSALINTDEKKALWFKACQTITGKQDPTQTEAKNSYTKIATEYARLCKENKI